MQRIAGSENMKENLTADKEDVDIFWKRLYEKNKNRRNEDPGEV